MKVLGTENDPYVRFHLIGSFFMHNIPSPRRSALLQFLKTSPLIRGWMFVVLTLSLTGRPVMAQNGEGELSAETETQADPAADWPPPAWTPDARKTTRRDLQDMFLSLADEALARGKPEIFAAHFRSLALVVEAYGDRAPEQVAALRDLYLSEEDNGPTHWSAYTQGNVRRPLFLAWRSPYSGSVGVTMVVLPKGWDPSQSYPLYLELHGKGPKPITPSRIVDWVNKERGIGQGAYLGDNVYVYPLQHDTDYTGVGELHLRGCLEIVDRYLRTDPARQYLYGFSLGACGSLFFGASTLEERGWAALAAFSPVVVHNEWIVSQLRHTPVWICYGEKELRWIQQGLDRYGMEPLRERLKAVGNPPEFEVMPGAGHEYNGDYQKKMLTFLSSRVNPDPVFPEWKTTRVQAFGDDSIELVVNGMPVTFRPESRTGDARIKAGRNIIAARVPNRSWGGGMFFASEADNGDVWKSDGSWKVTWRKPEGDWTSETYDDSDWFSAGVIGPVETWVGRERHEPMLEPILGKGVQLIGPPLVQQYRKAFESAGGEATLQIKGVHFTHRVWINGVLVGEGDAHVTRAWGDTKKGESAWPTVDYTCTTVPGRNVVALEITAVPQGGKGTLMQAAVFHPTGNGGIGRVRSGPGWRVSSSSGVEWTAVDFDDSDWFVTDTTFLNQSGVFWLDPAGPKLPTAFTVSPGDLYFRKVYER